MESGVRDIYRELNAAIQAYNDLLYADGNPDTKAAAMRVKQLTVKMGIHRELRLDSLLTEPYTEAEIARIETFAEELAAEKITGELYTMGKPYSPERIRSSIFAMCTEPIAYSWLALDKLRGKAHSDTEKHRTLFTRRYLEPARELVGRLLSGAQQPTDALICSAAGISAAELEKAREIQRALSAPQDMMARMKAMMASGAASKNPAQYQNHSLSGKRRLHGTFQDRRTRTYRACGKEHGKRSIGNAGPSHGGNGCPRKGVFKGGAGVCSCGNGD